MPSSSVEPETAKWLNLLRGSPSFVLVEGQEAGDETIQEFERVPVNSGMCWISGSITAASDRTFDAVHIVSTDDGGQLIETYIWADGWVPVAELPKELGVEPNAVFPYRYTLRIPLEDDRYSTS